MYAVRPNLVLLQTRALAQSSKQLTMDVTLLGNSLDVKVSSVWLILPSIPCVFSLCFRGMPALKGMACRTLVTPVSLHASPSSGGALILVACHACGSGSPYCARMTGILLLSAYTHVISGASVMSSHAFAPMPAHKHLACRVCVFSASFHALQASAGRFRALSPTY